MISLSPVSSEQRSVMDFAKMHMARTPPPARSTKPGTIALSFGRFSHEMRLIGDDHFDVADQASRSRVGIELDGIARDVEIGAPDEGAFSRTQEARFQIENRRLHVDLQIDLVLRRKGGDL